MRYRMLDVRIWCDKKFRSLTPLKPSGQALFLYLLSNPHTTSIPGLYRAGAKARVIFIPNAIKYNKPQSLNVVRSWAVHWDEIPECALKNEACCKLESFIQGLGKVYALAFSETLLQYSIKEAKQIGTKACFNQEQEEKNEIQFLQESPVSLVAKPPVAAQTKYLLTIPLENNPFYQVTRREFAEWQCIYNEVDVSQELHKPVSWNEVNPNKRKQRRHILRHIHTWLTREQQQKLKLSSLPHTFPMTFDHNLQTAKNWLIPISDSAHPSDKSISFQLLNGKNFYDHQ